MSEPKGESNESAALNAILEEAEKLLKEDLPSQITDRINLIHSIARYRHDVRSSSDRDP